LATAWATPNHKSLNQSRTCGPSLKPSAADATSSVEKRRRSPTLVQRRGALTQLLGELHYTVNVLRARPKSGPGNKVFHVRARRRPPNPCSLATPRAHKDNLSVGARQPRVNPEQSSPARLRKPLVPIGKVTGALCGWHGYHIDAKAHKPPVLLFDESTPGGQNGKTSTTNP